MFVSTPIHNDSGDVVGVLAFRLRPEKDLTHILSVSRFGDTGETYAFNDEGVLVSNSRFDPQLVSMGLLQPEDNSIFNIQIRDPGRDLTIKKLRPGEDTSQWPLTVMAHQERWDGSGYPNNLKGEEIPLAGRIVAICDVFDALTSKRYYKEAFSIEKSMEIIEQSSGKDFESRLVEAFKKALPEMIRIVKELPDDEPADILKVYRKNRTKNAA